MHSRVVGRRSVTITMVIALLVTLPGPTLADGIGVPPLSNPELWAQLEEGQQIAVITLGSGNTAHVDLFISMLDRCGVANEITFLLPLGVSASEFGVGEVTSLQFDEGTTSRLDRILLTDAKRIVSYRRSVVWALLLGTLFINGAWTWPFWFLWSLASCAPGAEVAPIATYETESSQVAIYDVQPDSDLRAFVEATGLDSAVQETLSRLRGQQVAVISLQTLRPTAQVDARGEPAGSPGIHLSWATAMASTTGHGTYAYPLGTGSAWAHPIELTRIYVAAPPGVDFAVHYPKLGADQSGFTMPIQGQSRPHILGAQEPAYAVENAVGEFGRVWRVTYMYSNSSEDVIITRLPDLSSETQAGLRRHQDWAIRQTLTSVLSLVVALLLWLAAWRYTMPRLLGIAYSWRGITLYRHALGWALLYPLTNGVVLGLTVLVGALTAGTAFLLGAPLLLVTLVGGLSVLLFVRWSSQTLGISQGRALGAYVVVAILSNVLFLMFALAFATWMGRV